MFIERINEKNLRDFLESSLIKSNIKNYKICSIENNYFGWYIYLENEQNIKFDIYVTDFELKTSLNCAKLLENDWRSYLLRRFGAEYRDSYNKQLKDKEKIN